MEVSIENLQFSLTTFGLSIGNLYFSLVQLISLKKNLNPACRNVLFFGNFFNFFQKIINFFTPCRNIFKRKWKLINNLTQINGLAVNLTPSPCLSLWFGFEKRGKFELKLRVKTSAANNNYMVVNKLLIFQTQSNQSMSQKSTQMPRL